MATRAEPIVTLDTVDSTQRVAFELAADGAPDGAVVVANHQHAGRGRRGRVWQAAPGTSLLASIVLRPRLAPPEAPRLSFAAAIAVAEAIERLTGVTPKLKWPNDVLLRGRKVAGILLEARAEASIVVLGIGVNLGQTSFPDDVGNTNTKIGVFDGRTLVASWRLTSRREQTADEYGLFIETLLRTRDLDRRAIHGIAISNVVPPVQQTLEWMCEQYFGIAPYFV